jgi:hypothetical protein
MSLTPPERETIITFNDEDETARVWTAQPPWITKLRNNPAATLLDEGKHGTSAGAEFEVPKELLTIRSKKVKRRLTPEQRQAASDRLERAREARAAGRNHEPVSRNRKARPA